MEKMTAAQLREMYAGKKKRGSPEFGLHLSILEFLAFVLPDDAVLHHSPNELDMRGEEAARQIAKARKLGTRKGWPDLEILWQSRMHFMEIKVPGNDLDDDQADLRDELIRAGALHRMVSTVFEVEQALKDWGMI